MLCRAVGLCHRAVGAFLLLLLLISGAEIALRLRELQTQRSLAPARTSAANSLTIPSWTTYHELRPLATLTVKSQDEQPAGVVRINQLGLRGPDVAVPKPPDVYRVLCLGDESLLGITLPDESLLTSRLQERLQTTTRLQVEVWNAGVPGACPLTESLLVMHRLAALQPDLLIAMVDDSDLSEDHAYRRYTRVDAHGTPLACRHPTLGRKPRGDQLTAWRDEFRLIDLGLRWAGDTWKRKTELDGAFDPEGGALSDIPSLRRDPAALERTAQPLATLARWCRGSASALCVLSVTASPPSTDASLASVVQTLADSESFPLVPVTRALPTAGSRRKKFWTADEHREFADRLAERVVTAIPGPWSSPYFRTEDRQISPAGLEFSQEPRPLMRQ